MASPRETLTSGTYSPKNEVTVTVWPAPDAEGDGEEVTVPQYGTEGDLLGHEVARDDSGNILHHYSPPPGFVHIPTREPGADGSTGAYVRSNDRGGIKRNGQGHAVGIKPGTALVEHADGTHDLLRTDYAQLLFLRAHDKKEEGGE